MLSLLAVFALVGGVASWPQLAPNCGLEGNWTNEAVNGGVTVQNLTAAIFPNIFRVTHVTHNTCFSGMTTAKDHRALFLYASNKNNKHQKLYMALACYGNELWGMDVPLGDNPVPATRIFTLNKVPPNPTPPPSPEPSKDPKT